MTRISRTWLAVFATAALTLPAISQAADPAMAKGGMLVDSKSMTLYTYDADKDKDGKSMCNGGCAENWPPLKAMASDKAAGDYTVIKRDDGSMQWAYKGMPLYMFKMDTKAGDMAGDGKVGKMGKWHVVKAM